MSQTTQGSGDAVTRYYDEDGKAVCQICGKSYTHVLRHIAGGGRGDPPHADVGIETKRDYRDQFPDAPTTAKEATDYGHFTDDGQVVCQDCGESFDALAGHLKWTHDYDTVDEYRRHHPDAPVNSKHWGNGGVSELGQVVGVLEDAEYEDLSDWPLREVQRELELLDDIAELATDQKRELKRSATEFIRE